MPTAEFRITPEKINAIGASYRSKGITITQANVEQLHREFIQLTTSIKGQYLAHITRVMENYFREMTGNPLFIIKYTPYADHTRRGGCAAAFHPGRRFVIFYPPDMPERDLRVRLAHELGHLFLLASLEGKKKDKRLPVYEGTTEPLSSIFGIFTISDKNDFYANARESGRNHEKWEDILKDFLDLSDSIKR
jgi:hypothetical protein